MLCCKFKEALQIFLTLAKRNPESFLSDVANIASNLAVFYQDDQPDREQSLALVKDALKAAITFGSYLKFTQDSIERAERVIKQWGLDVRIFKRDRQIT